MMTVPSLNGKGQDTPWQTQSVRQFFNRVNWDNLPPTALSSTASGTAPSFDAQAPMPLSLSVGQFFAAVNWDAVEMTAPVPPPALADSPPEPSASEVFTLTDFSDLF